MKTPDSWNLKSLAGKMALGLLLAAMVVSMDVAPASAGEHGGDGGRGGHYDNRGRGGHFDNRGRGYRGGPHRGYYRGGVYRSYGYVEPVYAAPVYVPPPVYYAPAPAPGVSIFLPSIHIR
jgi:uncharacterized membrane protein